jgi:hypothetical protein
VALVGGPRRLTPGDDDAGGLPAQSGYTFSMRLATDLSDGSAVPYFMWDEPLTLDDLRSRLAGSDEAERTRLAAKVMREARFDEAVQLVPVARIVAEYPQLRSNLGRRRAFWDFLIAEWRSLGLIS